MIIKSKGELNYVKSLDNDKLYNFTMVLTRQEIYILYSAIFECIMNEDNKKIRHILWQLSDKISYTSDRLKYFIEEVFKK